MTSIRTVLRMGWLSQAAYAALSQATWGVGDAARVALRSALQRDPDDESVLALGQARQLVDGGSGLPGIAAIHQQSNTASGMSATLFRESDGRYVLAARGTEPTLGQTFEDILVADVFGIALSGVAREQLVDLYRYYRRLSSTSGPVQYTAAELAMLSTILGGGNPVATAGALAALTLQTANDPTNKDRHKSKHARHLPTRNAFALSQHRG